MKNKSCLIYSFAILLLGFIFYLPVSLNAQSSTAYFVQLNDDTINPVTAEFIIHAIDKTHTDKAQCLIIKLDTPGGLLNSTRSIVKKMLTAQVPIVVYIAPSGSRAGSAGVFITYASHIAAMAPSTNIGAAHPVQMGGGKESESDEWKEIKELLKDIKEERSSEPKEEGEQAKSEPQKEEKLHADENPMESKILNDTVAFIKSIAKLRGRNVEWAVKSVVESDSITAEEALEKGVVEYIASNEDDLLNQIDGKVVSINGQDVTLNTKDSALEEIRMDPSKQFFNIIANPTIAYFLLILGFYGLLYEITHPGFGLPGILGAIFLILAFYSMQTLPTNYAGLALMGLGVILMITEAMLPGFGLFALGGIACLVLGSMLLFETADPVMKVSLYVIIAVALSTAFITLFLLRSVLRIRGQKVQGGKEGLLGETAEVVSPVSSQKGGKVFVHGELWDARSDQLIEKGQEVIVAQINGLTLSVKPK